MGIRWCTVLAGAATAGCDGVTGLVPWHPLPDTVQLHSLSRGEWVGQAGAFDFVYHRSVIVEGADEFDGWDIAAAEEGDEMRFLLPGSFPGLGWSSGVQLVGDVTFEELATAPSEGYDSLWTAAVEGAVYAVRTRALGECSFYAKLQVLETDLDRGIMRFQYVANPNCNHRSVNGN